MTTATRPRRKAPARPGSRLALQRLSVQNLLSFDDRGAELEFRPLNVLIGPNAAGKSNLLEIVNLLRSTPRDLSVPLVRGGGFREWKWKGSDGGEFAKIEALVAHPEHTRPGLVHTLLLSAIRDRPYVAFECIEESASEAGKPPTWHFMSQEAVPRLRFNGKEVPLIRDYDLHQSVLSQRRDPDLYPEVTHVGQLYQGFRLYRSWDLGPEAEVRKSQPPDLPSDYLQENLHNLGLVLNRLQLRSDVWDRLTTLTRALYEDAERVSALVDHARVQVWIHEKHLEDPVSSIRLSDGTLRWLCLLAILLHPSPPPLVCIEEPELGLHPDLLPTLADLLREASERMQLIITTHSDALVDSFTDTPESVVVCEKQDGATRFHRLRQKDLRLWLEKYRLGALWTRGQLGGTRW